jgi:hypothetical protein
MQGVVCRSIVGCVGPCWSRVGRFVRTLIAAGAFTVIGALAHSAAAEGVAVQAGMGVTFSQMSFTFVPEGADATREPERVADTNTGEMTIDLDALRTSTGRSSGFLNVRTAQGWVVQNVPILPGFAFPGLRVSLSLADQCCEDVALLSAAVLLTDDPVLTFEENLFVDFPVGDVEVNLGGGGFEDLDAIPLPVEEAPIFGSGPVRPPQPPRPVALPFHPQGENRSCLPWPHPDVEAAAMQCVPASLSNNIQWLEDVHGVFVPQLHQPGLRFDGRNTLVGRMDHYTNRGTGTPLNVNDRRFGSGVGNDPQMFGKMSYINENGLAASLALEHQYPFHVLYPWVPLQFPGQPPTQLTRNLVVGNVTSAFQGRPSAGFIIDRICRNSSVEATYFASTYGHAVTIVGAGRVYGVLSSFTCRTSSSLTRTFRPTAWTTRAPAIRSSGTSTTPTGILTGC